MSRAASSRRSASRRRLAEQSARNVGQVTCQVAHCGAILETDTDALGRTIVRCRQCERRRAGICRDCPRPIAGVAGKAIRCASCARRARRDQKRASVQRHLEDVRARARARYQDDPEIRARQNAIKRAWRKANPEKVRAQKQRYTQRHRHDPNSRYLAYHRLYNANPDRQIRKRAGARAAYYREHPVRPKPHCVQCGREIPWPVRRGGRPPKRCTFHRNKYDVRAAALRWAARDEASVGDAARQRQAPRFRVRQPQPAPYAPTGERLCVTPGCDIVLTGRKKKCTKCRERERALALQLLERSRGRGRRTDLERRAS